MVVDPTAAPGQIPFLTADEAPRSASASARRATSTTAATLESAARRRLGFPAPFGLTLRYAMKANPSRGILTLFRDLGLHIDASSDYEVERAIRAGVRARADPAHVADAVAAPRGARWRGVLLNACSLHQLEAVRRGAPGGDVSRPPEPRAGQRLDQPHQHRRPRLQLRHLARATSTR